ncbi:MAG: RrF2 family transcriptional regulator [Anaerolineae bacterium]
MRLTRGSEYGILGVMYLAGQPPGTITLINKISQAQDIPESYLAKIFQDLAKRGLLVSHRGAKGGFSLAREPSQITLREIIEAIEGPIALVNCLDGRQGCERLGSCSLYNVMDEAQAKMLEVLERTTMEDLVTNGT